MVVLVGLVHIARVHYYLDHPWKQALWITIGAASILSVVYVRVLKPVRLRHDPYRVTEIKPEADGVWTLTLTPDGGEASRFRAGQFAFVTVAETPFSLEQHPFSLASSAHRHDQVDFTIKQLGDFTNDISHVPIGQRAFVDGPYGSLTIRVEADAGLFVIAGGIGITPIMSVLRTLADEHSSVAVVLLYANNHRSDIAFVDELHRLQHDSDLDLSVVHVLVQPPAEWAGETGFVTAELIAQHLPQVDPQRWQYMLCGPPPLMQAAEQALITLGIPITRIDSERFDIGAATATGQRQTNVRRLVIALGAVMVMAALLFAA